MLKVISTKTQMKLLFIPFINVSIMFIWVFVNLKSLKDISFYKELYKSLFVLLLSFLVVLPLPFLKSSLFSNFPEIESWLELIIYYIWSTVAMALLVWFQKKKGI